MKKTPFTIGSPQKLGMQLRQARVNQKITQQEMADFCGISKNHLSAIERGLHNASAQLLLQYAYKLDLSLDELVGIKEEQKILPELQTILNEMPRYQQLQLLHQLQSPGSDLTLELQENILQLTRDQQYKLLKILQILSD